MDMEANIGMILWPLPKCIHRIYLDLKMPTVPWSLPLNSKVNVLYMGSEVWTLAHEWKSASR